MQAERRPCAVTLHAADAFLYLVFTACPSLDRQIWIRKRLPGDMDNIGRAGGERLFHMLRIGEGADSRHIGLYMLFDFRCVFDVAAVLEDMLGCDTVTDATVSWVPADTWMMST